MAIPVLVACQTTATPPNADAVTIDKLIAVADGDHLASTYVDGMLSDPAASLRDLLLSVRIIDGDVRIAQVEVPNSVTAAPEVLALTPDGTTAFVAERLGRRGPNDTRADQLPPGVTLSSVDVSDAANPAPTDSVTISENSEAIGVSPDGRRVAVIANTSDAAVLEIIPWAGDTFGPVHRIDLASVGITGTTSGPRRGVLATNVHWHPSGRALAINIDSHDRVAFFTVADDPVTGLRLEPWGAPVATGADPYAGRFTPDGRHYVTANWGRNLSTTVMAERLPRTPSTLSVIRLGALDDTAGGHRVVSTAQTDKSTEGLAISPDGALLATVNMRGTAFPPDSPMFDEEASVSLLRLDPDTGALTKLDDQALTAVLPEGGTFDSSGHYFIATSFQGRGPGDGGPGLQIYRVDGQSGLIPVQRVSLPHGVHHVVAG